MHKLLRAPRGCPKSGKAAAEPERSGGWGRGSSCRTASRLSSARQDPLALPPERSDVGITRSLGPNNKSPNFLRVCPGVGQERLLGSWGNTGDNVAPLTTMQGLPCQHWCLSSPSNPTGAQGCPCSAVQTRSGLP